MRAVDAAFLERLRATFRAEADEHLEAIVSGLLALENEAARDAVVHVERVFRAAHSLKGAARAVDFDEIESACETLEDLFARWKREGGIIAGAELDAAHRHVDTVTRMLAADRDAVAKEAAPATPEPAMLGAGAESVRVPVAVVDARLLEAEELITAKMFTGRAATELGALLGGFADWWRVHEALAPRLASGATNAEAPAALLARGAETLAKLEAGLERLAREMAEQHRAVCRQVDDLLDGSKRLLLVTFATIAPALHKLVRDLARDADKQVTLVIRGEDVEIDKRVLDALKDPLVQVLRNAVDHGLDGPAPRRAAGKPPHGTIVLEVRRLPAAKILLSVADDGRGIDVAAVRAAAAEHGVMSADDLAGIDDASALALVFRPALSTRAAVTRVSGRGVGLAIVCENVHAIGGEIAVESRPGEGTCFHITVPAQRATHRGVLVESAGQVFALPTAEVERVLRVPPDAVSIVEGRAVLETDGASVALIELAKLLGHSVPAPGTARQALVVGDGTARCALAVDAVLGEQELLLKPFRKPLARVRNVAAATLLATGRLVPVLRVGDLLKSARRDGGGLPPLESAVVPPHTAVLVAEDSITSRLLLKTILEAAGYAVETAVDGFEAWMRLQVGGIAALVSDVEMPRLDGFALTARIRADRRLSELPVVLVTALDTPTDRERGIDAGANAYLVKGSLAQDELVSAVARLVGRSGSQ